MKDLIHQKYREIFDTVSLNPHVFEGEEGEKLQTYNETYLFFTKLENTQRREVEVECMARFVCDRIVNFKK